MDQKHLVDPAAKVIAIEPIVWIEFSRYGAFAQKHYSNGRIEDIPVEDAMKEFDRLAAAGAFDR